MKPIMVCNKADEPRRPHTVGGYQCEKCHAELMVTQSGVQQLKAHPFTMLCMQCGLKVTEEAAAKGELSAVGFSPEALESLRKLAKTTSKPPSNTSTASWARRAGFNIDIPDNAEFHAADGAQHNRIVAAVQKLAGVLMDETDSPAEGAMALTMLSHYLEEFFGVKVLGVAVIPHTKGMDS